MRAKLAVRKGAGLVLGVSVLIGIIQPAAPAVAIVAVLPNSGLPGSTCLATNGGFVYTAPDAGVSTSRLGTDAPAYYEMGKPTGAYEGQIAKAIMIVIHGGAWYTTGKEVVAATSRMEA